eukprot:gnl/MRDRNA2_/MRDRNA2_50790_c0_seq1.p2 gnl/MRDRNA2_/MRDRNA2_50790_c0~~gnl/MRDRNA2_/MRDRNA2_50790_c0_seq1.p2  ORF type:complete len:121 (+),score=20.30 gnl/MRDRNA2_/MRDRNA2_50790_c0_seq1:262-624(+)
MDYVATLNACLVEEFEYVLVLEDDAVATSNFLPKIASAVEEARSASSGKWRTLKLFMSEYFAAGWINDWTTYELLLVYPVLVGTIFSVGIATVAHWVRQTPSVVAQMVGLSFFTVTVGTS